MSLDNKKTRKLIQNAGLCTCLWCLNRRVPAAPLLPGGLVASCPFRLKRIDGSRTSRISFKEGELHYDRASEEIQAGPFCSECERLDAGATDSAPAGRRVGSGKVVGVAGRNRRHVA